MSILSENRISLATLAKANGVNVATCWRWATRGVKGGIRLETICIGGRCVTSQEAFERFIAAINAEFDAASCVNGAPGPALNPTERQRQKAIADATAALKADAF